MVCGCLFLCVCLSPRGTGSVWLMFTFIVLCLIVFSVFFIKFVMNTYHAASWSDPYSSSDEEEICLYTDCELKSVNLILKGVGINILFRRFCYLLTLFSLISCTIFILNNGLKYRVVSVLVSKHGEYTTVIPHTYFVIPLLPNFEL